MSSQRKLAALVVALLGIIVPVTASAAPTGEPGDPELHATLAGGAGSGGAVSSCHRGTPKPPPMKPPYPQGPEGGGAYGP
jgi:hypothetical protein